MSEILSEILSVDRYDEITRAAGGPISHGEALMRLHAHDTALRAENERLREAIEIEREGQRSMARALAEIHRLSRLDVAIALAPKEDRP